MTIAIQTSTTPPPHPGDTAGEQHVSTDLRVVDANQLPGPDGKTPNVATEFKLGTNGQPIQVGSQIIPPPPHDPKNDEGPGSVFWRGFRDGFAHPATFFSTADAMRNAALNDRELTPEELRAARNRGAAIDDWLSNAPIIGTAMMGGRAVESWGNAIGGYSSSDESPPAPVVPDVADRWPDLVAKSGGHTPPKTTAR
ncbi:hypothetical protein G3N95_25440 [Paraburkholderia sp. Tr-20389]|uniref:hypothetical protein n=1 Tax=Paraburkholderia sp. Tr-20389 TaxID=2703903 RepID=UPI001981B07E|nr:hypothetical protein [Paraburkholderia sp. Tr-20389]MBN3756309.1 hypothetical protein [Paraburkholderia sp. Tr-20389]